MTSTADQGAAPIGSQVAARASITSADTQLARRALTIAQRTALGVLGDPEVAQDVAQDVAVRVLERIGTLRDPDRLDAWVHRIAVHTALSEARRAKLRRVAEGTRHRERRGEDAAPSASSAIESDVGPALALLAGLPARQRAALTLRYVHDLTDDEIGAALGCREATVRSLLSRGRAALRAALENRPNPRSSDADDH